MADAIATIVDQVVRVSIQGADLLEPLVTRAETAAENAEEDATDAGEAADRAEAARDLVLAAFDQNAIDHTFTTKAEADAGIAGVTNGEFVQVLIDETVSNHHTVYQKTAGAYVFKYDFNEGDELLFEDYFDLEGDGALTYTGGTPTTVAAGDPVRTVAENEALTVAASGATDHHVTTTGGVKLYRNLLQDIEVTVGTAGEFLTLNKALEHLTSIRRGYLAEGATATALILDDGWEMAEQVIATFGVDLSFITILSDQATPVIINRDALTRSSADVDGLEYVFTATAAFMIGEGCRGPRLGCRMSMDASGAAGTQHGIFLNHGAQMVVAPSSGIDDATGLGAYVINGSRLIARASIWEGNGSSADPFFAGGIRADWASLLQLAEVQVLDSLGQGVMVNGASQCSMRAATISGSVADQLQTGACSIVHTNGIQILNGGARGAYISEGSQVRFLGGTIDGNTLSGLHIDQGSSVNAIGSLELTNNGQYGARVLENSRLTMIAPVCSGNTVGGLFADGGHIVVTSSGSSTGHPAGKDIQVGTSGTMRLATFTTSSGSSIDNNVTDSNVSCFNSPRRADNAIIIRQGALAWNSGTATIGAAATSVTVTHGVGFTPLLREVTARPEGTGGYGSATKCWVENMTATTFDVKLDVVPGSIVTIGWQVRRQHG